MDSFGDTPFPLKEEHTKLIAEAGCDLEKIIAFRRDVHQNPETGFKEFETSRKIKELLLSFGIEEENIKACAGTGLVVDIVGTHESVPEGGANAIALRADMDALPMPENTDVPYKSTLQVAHMCGHDGHTATLVATA